MARFYTTCPIAGHVDVVVPIPVHRSRLIERGFNQAEELSRQLCARSGLRLESGALIKPEETAHQVNLPKDERARNLREAFRVSNPARIRGKRVLLVDDVLTTGSTLDAAARVLISAGAASVYGYTLARSI